MNVKGLSISEIMDIDLDAFNSLKESDLRHLTSRLVSAANKRVRRLEAKGINSPAMRNLGNGKRFSTKLEKGTKRENRVNKLRQEFARARSFLSSETSTIKGYGSYVRRTKEEIADALGMSMSDLESSLDINRLFDLLHKAQERGIVSSYRGSEGSVHSRGVIADLLVEDPSMDEEILMARLEKRMAKWYEEKELAKDETEGFDM